MTDFNPTKDEILQQLSKHIQQARQTLGLNTHQMIFLASQGVMQTMVDAFNHQEQQHHEKSVVESKSFPWAEPYIPTSIEVKDINTVYGVRVLPMPEELVDMGYTMFLCPIDTVNHDELLVCRLIVVGLRKRMDDIHPQCGEWIRGQIKAKFG